MKWLAGIMPMNKNDPIIKVKNLTKAFPVYRGAIFKRKLGDMKAVDSVSFDIQKGKTLGLVGESGCGKTTTGRAILHLEKPTSGQVIFKGQDITRLGKYDLRKLRRDIQIIYQDPFGSLNPRMKIRDIVGEPLRIHSMAGSRAQYLDQVGHLLEVVGLSQAMAGRYPHEFSGGQRQRIGIARALAVKPDFIVCDEPVSALDVSIQAQIINLLKDLQEKFNLTYLFIAHDLAVVRHISDRIAVMYLGQIVEIADSRDLYQNPGHPYTKALLAAAPIPDPEKEQAREHMMLSGEVPGLLNIPKGCRFHPRCPFVEDVCKESRPGLETVSPSGHKVACHLTSLQ
jgi:oligopeptide transport system ATP-binding protein